MSENLKELEWFQELQIKLPARLFKLLKRRDASSLLAEKLPKVFPPNRLTFPSDDRRAWELVGSFFLAQNRYHEAIQIYEALYKHTLLAQEQNGKWVEKGRPLVWISQCYASLGYIALAKRFLMLTLCEDVIRDSGQVSPENTGSYFRLVWERGLPDLVLRKYAKQIYNLARQNPHDSLYPEWILQQLDQDWLMEFPVPQEAGLFVANTLYIKKLITQLGTDQSGKQLEALAQYLLSCMPGCRATRRQRSGSTDYDVVCSMEGFDVDFRSELGRYFVCECKDWKTPADFTTFAKFCRVLDSIKARFGILFSKSGISGQGRAKDAEREQIKVFQDRGMVIVVIDQIDLNYIAQGGHFTNLLRGKYERVRLDVVGHK